MRDMAFSYDLCGAQWEWSPAAADPADEPRAKGWWPSLDLETTKSLTRGSRPHEECLALLSQPGRLVLSTQLILPEGMATVRLESNGEIEDAVLGDAQGEPEAQKAPDALHRVEMKVESKAAPVFLSFAVKTGQAGKLFALKASYRMAGDKAERVLTRKQSVVPWAPIPAAATANTTRCRPRPLWRRRGKGSSAFLRRARPLLAMSHVQGAGGQDRAGLDRRRPERPSRYLSEHRGAGGGDRA